MSNKMTKVQKVENLEFFLLFFKKRGPTYKSKKRWKFYFRKGILNLRGCGLPVADVNGSSSLIFNS